ncbi:MAG TPA: cytochrome c3 family protein, partial [Usitatibacteraceae bacterium]|nr:cytochrome c3 family protein [Usitatibacteraceae bacterium]
MRTPLRLGCRRAFGSILRASLLAAIVALSPLTAAAKDNELSKEDQACLKCHDKPGLEKKLGDGTALSLHISTQAYLDSMHAATSCADCHADIDDKTHGKTPAQYKSRRELSLSMRDSCRDCHKKKFTQYEDSVHAAVQKAGSNRAPLCSDCHEPHTQKSVKASKPAEAAPCARCHDEIHKAYSNDVHGQLRAAKGKDAPGCADCHRSHEVQAASLGDTLRDTCLACHKDAAAQHRDWLPNTQLHFDAISCAACHAPQAARRVNLRLYDGLSGSQVREKVGVPQFESRALAADSARVGLDERALWSLLNEFNRDSSQGKVVLRGRLEVSSGADAHRLTRKQEALRDCRACHQAGAAAFQSVSMTVVGPDGRPLRHGVQKEVLSSPLSVQSVRGFYALGATRIQLLDQLLLLVVLGSIAGPLLHMTIKWA